jgi:hypothetical protein
MKTWILVGVAAILGLGVGIGGAVVRLERTPWNGSIAVPKKESQAAKPTGLRPKVSVDDETHDFGALDSHSTGRHTFVFRNVGDDILTLIKGDTTCKCTASLLGGESGRGELAPGKSTEVTLEWKGKGFAGPFHQSATIHTNDPDRPRVTLTITGRILTAVRTVPAELVLSGISAGESATGEVKLYGFYEKPLKITGHEFSDPSTADKFDVAFEPLSADEVAKEQDARNGHRVQVTVKPGLPPGAFEQRITLKTDSSDAPTVEIPVRGTISSEISIIGPGWNEEQQVLSLGTNSGQADVERTMRILIRGSERKEVVIEPVEVKPELLEVSLGKPTEWQGGQVVQVPLTVRIPKGGGLANYLGPERSQMGSILLKTSHPKVPQLRIYVRFAVVH